MKRQLRHLFSTVVIIGAGLAAGCTSAPELVMTASAQTAARVFEMRTYTAHVGKLDALHARFRDHTVRLFEKHGMTNVGYWVPRDSARADNTLIYILAYPSRAFADSAWAAFRADPEWVTARAASEAAGPIVQRVESVFMDATDYSAMR